MTPVLQGDSVLELQPHHQGPLFFPAEGWEHFWQSSDFERFLFNAAPRWQFPPRDSTSRVGMDIQQREVQIPGDPGIHHEVPDILHPHQCHHTQGLGAGWLSLLVPRKEPMATSPTLA